MTAGQSARGWAPWVLLALLAACTPDDGQRAPQSAGDGSGDFISGRVTNARGRPEAGVWVIAATDGLPTGFRKIVVSDDDGRFVLPELPDAMYRVWVRGYGLVDSPPVAARPGSELDLDAVVAPDAWAAAWIYPASYWLSMLQAPGADADWVSNFKLGCQLCHQLGSVMTRYKDRHLFEVGLKKASYMHATAEGLGRGPLLDALTDWSARIVAGETPPVPPRPQGIERNFVITQWDWGDARTYAHDEIATDKRNPTVNAGGPIFGVDLGNDRVLSLDPASAVAAAYPTPTLGGFDVPWCEQTWQMPSGPTVPVGFGSLGCPLEAGITGFEGAYDNPANPHNPMFDADGRVWITTQVRREWDADLPTFCHDTPGIAGNYHHRQLGWFDPADNSYQLIDTCYGTHHLQFDDHGVLWTSGDAYGIGWFDPAQYDPADPDSLARAQGFAVIRIDSNGDGEADTPITGFNYGVVPNPVDGSIWTAQPGGEPGGPPGYRGRLVRYDPAAGTFETYVPPAPGAGPRGVDVDSDGIVWVALGGSGHLGRFDRSKCPRHWGAGEQCPQGWTLFRSPGPLIATGPDPADERSADFHYYLFVDRFDTLGLGADTVVLNGTGSDSLLAFDANSRTFTVIRVPYPLNTYTRGLDGRIDAADAGWKGRGLWFTNGLDPIWHAENGRSYVGRVQLRPDPLAR